MDYGINSQQLAVICALSNGASLTLAAEQAGLHRNTIYNWRRNSLPFQQALAHAQYDRAMYFREKIEAFADLAIAALREILADPKASPSVRLRAALAVLQLVSTPPAPKKQVELDIEKIVVQKNPTAVVTEEQLGPSPLVHNSAQSPSPQPDPPKPYRRESPKIGRNDPCPCGSGLKYKRCCIDKPTQRTPAKTQTP